MIDPSELQCLEHVLLFPALRSYSGYSTRCLYVYKELNARAVGYYPAPDGLGPEDYREPTSMELIDALSKLREVPDQDYNIRCAVGIVEKYLYGKE